MRREVEGEINFLAWVQLESAQQIILVSIEVVRGNLNKNRRLLFSCNCEMSDLQLQEIGADVMMMTWSGLVAGHVLLVNYSGHQH